MNEQGPNVRVVVLTPDPQRLRPEVLSKPFILYALIPHSVRISNVVSLPNIMSLMGGSDGGGGPPGFCATYYEERVKETRLVLLAGFLPGSVVSTCTEWFHVLDVVGGVASAAVVTTYVRLCPVEEPESEDDPVDLHTVEGVEAFISSAGYTPIPLVEYETPEVILNALMTQSGQGLGG